MSQYRRLIFTILQLIFSLLYLSSSQPLGTALNKFNSKIKVCVIGAGPAGIATTKLLAENLNKFEITVFEKAAEIGGNWVYTDQTGIDKYGYPVHSSMYKNLRTNSPKELVNFPDWPVFKGVNTSSVSHDTLLGYLRNYTDHFQLRRFIKLNMIVTNVKLEKINKKTEKWKVTVKNLQTSKTRQLIFDAVIICNGHNSSPRIPNIPGLKNFKGQILHSHDYRKPEYFRNKTVIILGASFSGIDIGQDLVNVASKVYLSHNKPQHIPVNLAQIKGIDKFKNGQFILKDNSTIRADVLLFCTGYIRTFPFLDKSAGIKVDDNYVSPLYKHIISITHPSMSFIGILDGGQTFPTVHIQAKFVVNFLKGQVQLPPKKVMLQDSMLKTTKKKDAHRLTDFKSYVDELANLGGFAPIAKYYKVGYEIWMDLQGRHLDDFKDYNLIINNDKASVNIVRP